MNVAVIPARGGSKRILKKNIRSFHGVPLISYSISAALRSEVFDAVVVSTDDEEIAEIAIDCGASVPFIRPSVLADDVTGTMDVIKHAAEFTREQGYGARYLCCVYPTAPFIKSSDILGALKVMEKRKSGYVFSASTYDYPVQRALQLVQDKLSMVYPEHRTTRSQDLPQYYHDAGQFYWGTVDAWIDGEDVFSHDSALYRIPRYRAIDIDTEEDWKMAELLYAALSELK